MATGPFKSVTVAENKTAVFVFGQPPASTWAGSYTPDQAKRPAISGYRRDGTHFALRPTSAFSAAPSGDDLEVTVTLDGPLYADDHGLQAHVLEGWVEDSSGDISGGTALSEAITNNATTTYTAPAPDLAADAALARQRSVSSVGGIRTRNVGPGLEYGTIQEAARAANSGDVINVAPGTYTVDINNMLTIPTGVALIGAGIGVTLIQADLTYGGSGDFGMKLEGGNYVAGIDYATTAQGTATRDVLFGAACRIENCRLIGQNDTLQPLDGAAGGALDVVDCTLDSAYDTFIDGVGVTARFHNCYFRVRPTQGASAGAMVPTTPAGETSILELSHCIYDLKSAGASTLACLRSNVASGGGTAQVYSSGNIFIVDTDQVGGGTANVNIFSHVGTGSLTFTSRGDVVHAFGGGTAGLILSPSGGGTFNFHNLDSNAWTEVLAGGSTSSYTGVCGGGSNLGFYDTQPVTRPVLPGIPTVNDVVNALVALGLVETS